MHIIQYDPLTLTRDHRLELERLDEEGDPLTSADAGRPQPVLFLLTAELVDEVGRDAGAGGGERVTQRNGTSVHVQLPQVNPKLLLAGERLGRKGLVDLKGRKCIWTLRSEERNE